MKMNIEQPHGVMLDADGNVVQRFGGWRLGEYPVPSPVETIEYVDGPVAHKREVYWKYTNQDAPVELAPSDATIANSGSDTVTISLTLNEDAEADRDVTLAIDGGSYERVLTPGEPTTETVTTTKPAGSTITVSVRGDQVTRTSTTIAVVSP
jgi:hypothetical protein